jgi:hypothetical protein
MLLTMCGFLCRRVVSGVRFMQAGFAIVRGVLADQVMVLVPVFQVRKQILDHVSRVPCQSSACGFIAAGALPVTA